MAAANEAQGLKIAVAAFVSLTVILAVTSYFLYSNYDQASAKLDKANQDLQTAKKAQSDAVNQYEDLRKRIGSKAEEFDAVKAEIVDRTKKIDDEILQLGPLVTDSISKAQAAGGSSADLEEAKARAQQIAASYQAEPNKNLISSLDRLKDLLRALAMLDTSLASNYANVRKSLESADRTNAAKLAVTEKQLADTKKDLADEQSKHVQARSELLTKVDQYQTEIARLNTEVASLNNTHRQYQEDTAKNIELKQNIIKELTDYKSKKETILDRPDGRLTFVDYNTGTVRTDITYSMGARPQMVMSIFDAGAPGIPTEKPKGTIELTFVGDKYSIARIIKTYSPIDPFRTGDIVYSPVWDRDKPMRVALIGKMDVNRDGKDDRQDLVRLIQSAGGVVDYDLPPPEIGKETGKITGRDAYYVIDELKSIRGSESEVEPTGSSEYQEYLKKFSNAIEEARANGVRPLPLDRLLKILGYDFHAPIRGRAEAVDSAALRNLLRGRPDAKKEAAPATENAAPAPEEAPK
jgi:hypothetical protein